MLDFRVNTFLTVCESGNYTKAAEKLGLTQPAVTQHIKYIEDRYKIRLFVKDGKTMRLTPEGSLLREMFITLSSDCKKIDRCIKKMNEESGALLMGVTKSIGEYVMPDILQKYLETNPSVRISMDVENTAYLLDYLKQGTIDFCIIGGKFDKNAYWHKLFSREKFVCLCSSSIPLSGKTADIEELFSERLLIREQGSGSREIFKSSLNQLGYNESNFKAVTEIGSIDVIKHLVKKGLGITFMYEAAAAEEIKNGSLALIDVKGFDSSHEFNFVCLKNSMFADEFSDFFDFAVKNRVH
ncbi:MAG: LysR family transcriptional regulator [Clostridiales bacterium]|nr:LysR family transcriptional regulator [Clostridiales bacterium]